MKPIGNVLIERRYVDLGRCASARCPGYVAPATHRLDDRSLA
jgi:hypothetical protein